MKTKQERLDLILNMMKTNEQCGNHYNQLIQDHQWYSFDWIVDYLYKPMTIRELDKLIVKLKEKFV